MDVLNYTEFRKNLAKTLDRANDDAKIVIVSRRNGKNVVMMGLDKYNSIAEILHLVKNQATPSSLANIHPFFRA